MESLPKGSTAYVGLRADEPDRLGIIRPENCYEIRYPLREWRWGINEVLNCLKIYGIQIPRRTDCGCCFFQRLEEWQELLERYPERYEKYVQIEKQMGHTFRSSGRDTWPAGLAELREEFLSGRRLRKFNSGRQRKCRFCGL